MPARLILCLLLLAAPIALAADTGPDLETRISIVESRLNRVELDVSRLSGVPTSLARIEEKVTALTERLEGQAHMLQAVGLAIIITVVTGTITVVRKRKEDTK